MRVLPDCATSSATVCQTATLALKRLSRRGFVPSTSIIPFASVLVKGTGSAAAAIRSSASSSPSSGRSKERVIVFSMYSSGSITGGDRLSPRLGYRHSNPRRIIARSTAITWNGLALLVEDTARPVPWGSKVRLRVPDWLPALVNAGRAFVVICAAELFWIVTEWPNGAQAITFAAIVAILLAPRADQAYAAAKGFMIGTSLTAVFAAIVAFAVLPNSETFVAFSLAIGLVLVPAGAGMAQPWQTVMFMAMAANFVPILQPANQQTYDTVQFYNTASAIVIGVGMAICSFRLIPPLSPAFRTRRLLALTLRDLRRLARSRIWQTPDDWEGRMYGRLSAVPDAAGPLPGARILAALFVGTGIIQLRRVASAMDLRSELYVALEALRRGNIALTTAHLDRLDGALAASPGAATLRARARVLAMSEVLTQHAAYFGAG
jgi:uncharacterized membrane protein YccC